MAVPARDEAANIVSCLRSIDDAARECPVPVLVAVAADACHDSTAAIARATHLSHAEVIVVEGRWLGASRARRAAVDASLAASAGVDLAQVWIANTDADCVVPSGWIVEQLRHAMTGAHAVAGIVRLDAATTSAHLLAQFTATYELNGASHRHVHAANLGLRADAYSDVGGWSTHTVVGEEHELWRRLGTNGYELRRPTSVKVTTSSRTISRIHGGFASALSRLASERRAPRAAS